MPKPKAHGHRQPHSRTGSSTSVVKLAALTPAHRQDSAQRLQLTQTAAATQAGQQPPKKTKQNGRHHQQGPVILQPAARRPATPPPPPAPSKPPVESPSSTTEDEWESSESGAVTPNPEPADSPGPAEPAYARPTLPPSMASDATVTGGSGSSSSGRPDDDPSPATPKPAQKPPLLDTAIAQLPTPASASRQPPALLASPAITSPPPDQAPQQAPSPARRPRPQSAIFPAGAAMTPLVPQQRRDSVPALDDDGRARHRHSSSAHRLSLQPGSSSSRPLSVHSIAAFPTSSRPHPLLRGLSHSGASVGPLLTSDPAHATLSPNPASQPSSPNSERIRPGASSSMSISGRLLRRTSQSSIKSVATLPATSTITALSTSPSASSTAENVNGTFGRPVHGTSSASAAVSSLAKATKSVAAPTPLWQTTVTFKASNQYHLDGGGAFALLSKDVRARHATVAKSHAPGIMSFQRVVAERMTHSKRRP